MRGTEPAAGKAQARRQEPFQSLKDCTLSRFQSPLVPINCEMADLAPEEHRWGRGQEMPFPAGRQHRKQEDTTIKHKAQRRRPAPDPGYPVQLRPVQRGRRGPFLPLVFPGAEPGLFPGRHKAEAFRAGGHSHRFQEPQRQVLPGTGTLGHLLIPIALLPVFFVGLFVLCFLVTGAFLLWTGFTGLAASL